MKKCYEKPTVEVVKFQYRDQVVAASGGTGSCYEVVNNIGAGVCISGNPEHTGVYQNDMSHL